MSGLLERAVEALERIAAALEGERLTPVTEEKQEDGQSSDSTSDAKETTGSKATSKTESSTSKKSDKGDSKVTREDVRDALKEVQKAHDAQTAREVLAGFGVTAISALVEGQYADVIEAARKAL